MLRSFKMRIAAVLPHVEIYGGVRRYIEIGNEFLKRGHDFVIFHPRGNKPEWIDFKGKTESFEFLEKECFDVGICSEYSILSSFDRVKARVRFFYFLLEGHKLEKKVIHSSYFFLGNSEGICRKMEKKYRITCDRAVGGVNTDVFYPVEIDRNDDEFRILCYGRIYKKRKGIQNVIRAVEELYKKYPQIKLVFFDSLVGEERRDPRLMIKTHIPHEFFINLPQDKMSSLYSSADVFVSAERRAGWSNTSAEAMACRVPVVCTKSGTSDFAFHRDTALVVPLPLPFLLRRQIKIMIEGRELREKIARRGYEEIRNFSWSSLAERLENIFREKAM